RSRIAETRAVPGDDLHAHAAGDARHLAADAAEADEAERLAAQLHALAHVPGAGADLAVHAGDIARSRQDERHRMLGDGGIAVALDRRDGDAEALGGRHVDIARGA